MTRGPGEVEGMARDASRHVWGGWQPDLMDGKDIFVAMLGPVDEFSKRTAEKIQSMKMSVLISRRFDYL